MDNKLVEVTLVLENCESIKIPCKGVNSLHYDINKTNYGMYFFDNTIYHADHSDDFHIGLNNDDLENIYVDGFRDYENKVKAIDRLKQHPDITWVYVVTVGSDGLYNEHKFTVAWNSNDEFDNRYQTLKLKKYRWNIRDAHRWSWNIDIVKCNNLHTFLFIIKNKIIKPIARFFKYTLWKRFINRYRFSELNKSFFI